MKTRHEIIKLDLQLPVDEVEKVIKIENKIEENKIKYYERKNLENNGETYTGIRFLF